MSGTESNPRTRSRVRQDRRCPVTLRTSWSASSGSVGLDGARFPATDQSLRATDRLPSDAKAGGGRRRGWANRRTDRGVPGPGGLPPALRPRGPIHPGASQGPGVPTRSQPEATARGESGGRRVVDSRPGGRTGRGLQPIQGMGQEGLCPCSTSRQPEASGDLGRCGGARPTPSAQGCFRPGRTSRYPAELTRPKDRPESEAWPQGPAFP